MIERDKRVLLTVIDSYVSDCVPVSSLRVQERGDFDLSTATIRNRLANLEREGFLAKTHTSSGRVPTDIGYRLYVDEIKERTAPDAELAQKCRDELRGHVNDASSIMQQASRFLGSLSRNFALVYGAIEAESRVVNVKLVRLEGNKVLVVVTMNPGHEKTTFLRLDRRFDGKVIKAGEKRIKEAVEGKSLEEARDTLQSIVKDNVTDEGRLIGEVVAQRNSLFAGPPAVELFFEERNHLLEQPELSDPKVLQLLLKLLHNKSQLTDVLSQRSSDRTTVTIGSENTEDELRPFSLITAGYRMGGARGVLGILGPTRMRYDFALALVSTVSQEMAAIGEEYF